MLTLETLCALGGLPPRQREALWDVAVLERPRPEVAADLGCTVKNVDYLVRQAQKELSFSMWRYRCEDYRF